MVINVYLAQPQGRKEILMVTDRQLPFWGAAIYDKSVDLGKSNSSITKKKAERWNKRDTSQNEKFDEIEVGNWVSITHLI